ncbi:MAG: CBS domain-containing protein, partial [Vallitaleaceae bacterium]|nr:CBS domain-containing protein [Vallitaleaceae bacterium]
RKEMQSELLNIEDYMDKTIVFITHDMNEAFRLGDRVALLKDGELVQIGKPKEFFENPANDYVRSFIEDVDKSRILRVKSVMHKPLVVAKPEDSVEATVQRIKEANRNFCYVTNQENILQGYISLEKLEDGKYKSVDRYLDRNYVSIEHNEFLSSIWQKFSDSDVDIAVVDKRNRLRGIIDYTDVANALA